jgi:hypothetical protein
MVVAMSKSAHAAADDRLPDSWVAVDADQPRRLRREVTPRDLERAVAEHDTVFEVSRDLRCQRRSVKRALDRLGLRDNLQGSYSLSHRIAGGRDE